MISVKSPRHSDRNEENKKMGAKTKKNIQDNSSDHFSQSTKQLGSQYQIANEDTEDTDPSTGFTNVVDERSVKHTHKQPTNLSSTTQRQKIIDEPQIEEKLKNVEEVPVPNRPDENGKINAIHPKAQKLTEQDIQFLQSVCKKSECLKLSEFAFNEKIQCIYHARVRFEDITNNQCIVGLTPHYLVLVKVQRDSQNTSYTLITKQVLHLICINSVDIGKSLEKEPYVLVKILSYDKTIKKITILMSTSNVNDQKIPSQKDKDNSNYSKITFLSNVHLFAQILCRNWMLNFSTNYDIRTDFKLVNSWDQNIKAAEKDLFPLFDPQLSPSEEFQFTYSSLCSWFHLPYHHNVVRYMHSLIISNNGIFSVNQCPDLHVNLKNNDLEPIFRTLLRVPYIYGIVCDSINKPDIFNITSSLIAGSRSIHLIHFHNCNATEGAEKFANALKMNPRCPIEYIDFSGNKLNFQNFFTTAFKTIECVNNRYLWFLNLNFTSITEDAIVDLFTIFETIENMQHIKYLFIAGSPITHSITSHFENYLKILEQKKMQILKGLDLSAMIISENDHHRAPNQHRVSPTSPKKSPINSQEEISIPLDSMSNTTNESEEDSYSLAEITQNTKATNQSNQPRVMSRGLIDYFIPLKKYKQPLSVLIIKDNKIPFDCYETLIDLIDEIPTLSTLDISNTGLTASQITYLIQRFSSHHRVGSFLLELRMNRLGLPKGSFSNIISGFLKGNLTRWHSIEFENNNLSDFNDIEEFISLCRNMPNLEELSLSRNFNSNPGIEILLIQLLKIRKLKVLKLCGDNKHHLGTRVFPLLFAIAVSYLLRKEIGGFSFGRTSSDLTNHLREYTTSAQKLLSKLGSSDSLDHIQLITDAASELVIKYLVRKAAEEKNNAVSTQQVIINIIDKLKPFMHHVAERVEIQSSPIGSKLFENEIGYILNVQKQNLETNDLQDIPKHIHRMIKEASMLCRLKELDISGNEIGEDGIIAVNYLLELNTNELEAIGIDGSKISKLSTIRDIVKRLEKFPHVVKMDFPSSDSENLIRNANRTVPTAVNAIKLQMKNHELEMINTITKHRAKKGYYPTIPCKMNDELKELIDYCTTFVCRYLDIPNLRIHSGIVEEFDLQLPYLPMEDNFLSLPDNYRIVNIGKQTFYDRETGMMKRFDEITGEKEIPLQLDALRRRQHPEPKKSIFDDNTEKIEINRDAEIKLVEDKNITPIFEEGDSDSSFKSSLTESDSWNEISEISLHKPPPNIDLDNSNQASDYEVEFSEIDRTYSDGMRSSNIRKFSPLVNNLTANFIPDQNNQDYRSQTHFIQMEGGPPDSDSEL